MDLAKEFKNIIQNSNAKLFFIREKVSWDKGRRENGSIAKVWRYCIFNAFTPCRRTPCNPVRVNRPGLYDPIYQRVLFFYYEHRVFRLAVAMHHALYYASARLLLICVPPRKFSICLNGGWCSLSFSSTRAPWCHRSSHDTWKTYTFSA